MALDISHLPPDENTLKPQPGSGDIDVEVADDPPPVLGDLQENEDGSVDVFLDDGEAEARESPEFLENLAEFLPHEWLKATGTVFKDIVNGDIEAREPRDKQYAEGVKRTGLGNEAPGGADFEGASEAVHPMLAQGSVDFGSRTIKELLPPAGPCKTKIVGEQTEEKLGRAERKKTYMNWQVTKQVEEYRAEQERLLSQVPLAGAAYKRWWWDPDHRRPRCEAYYIDDVFLPYGHSDFYTTPRASFRQRISKEQFEARVRQGLYIETAVPSEDNGGNTESAARQAAEKVEGVNSDSVVWTDQGLRTVWLIEAELNVPDDDMVDADDRLRPYIIHMTDEGDVVGVFRNWQEGDDRFRKKHWATEWGFIPWRGGPPVGLAHLIGSLSAAATGALRAVLDAAHISNFPGAVKLKAGRTAGQSIQVNATEVVELDAPAGVDDIRKLVMPFPFPGPSQVLFNVMEWLGQSAEKVVATASEKIADAKADMPVGTALALIEHGSANFSAIHARLHYSMGKDLEILHRLNSEYMDDEETVEELGELVVYREDFQGPMDIIPVSDPNIFSEAQRYAQLQAVLQLKADPQFVQFFKPERLLLRALKLLNVSDIEDIANLPKEEMRLGPLEENYAAGMQERPLKVFADQDHLFHLKVHIQFATSPMTGANPLIAAGMLPGMLQHCKEHLMQLWRHHVKSASETFTELMRAQGYAVDDEEAQLRGQAFADQLMAQILAPMVMPGLAMMQKAMGQIAQSQAPKPDPNTQLQETTKKEIEDMRIKAKQAEKQADLVDFEQDRRSTERLAQLATAVDLLSDQQAQNAQQTRDQIAQEAEKQMLVLKSFMDTFLQAAAPKQAPSTTLPDGTVVEGADQGPTPEGQAVQSVVQGLLPQLTAMLQEALAGNGGGPLAEALASLAIQQENMQQALSAQGQTNQDALATLAQGLQALAAQTQAQAPAAPQQPQLPPPQAVPPQAG